MPKHVLRLAVRDRTRDRWPDEPRETAEPSDRDADGYFGADAYHEWPAGHLIAPGEVGNDGA
jgi:hypothetical protein